MPFWQSMYLGGRCVLCIASLSCLKHSMFCLRPLSLLRSALQIRSTSLPHPTYRQHPPLPLNMGLLPSPSEFAFRISPRMYVLMYNAQISGKHQLKPNCNVEGFASERRVGTGWSGGCADCRDGAVVRWIQTRSAECTVQNSSAKNKSVCVHAGTDRVLCLYRVRPSCSVRGRGTRALRCCSAGGGGRLGLKRC